MAKTAPEQMMDQLQSIYKTKRSDYLVDFAEQLKVAASKGENWLYYEIKEYMYGKAIIDNYKDSGFTFSLSDEVLNVRWEWKLGG